jgi:tetratricopeptide (TPR) repeat protein
MPVRSSLYSHPVTEEGNGPANFPSDGEEMTESTNPTVWNEKGNIHFQNGAYEEAIVAYNKAIELDRSFGWPYSNLALTYLTLGKYAEAILLYQRSTSLLETNMEKAAVWNSLGNIYRHLNDYDNALQAYQKADELDPENAGRRGAMDLSSEPELRLGIQQSRHGICAGKQVQGSCSVVPEKHRSVHERHRQGHRLESPWQCLPQDERL